MTCRTPAVTIRSERRGDEAVIAEITREAFQDRDYSSGTEHFIIDALRRKGALTISLVAELDGAVIGHIAFSPVEISDCSKDWYGLGPIAVKPELQRHGIGQALVRSGLAELRKLRAQGCVLVGDPGFYGRFGFQRNEGIILDGAPQEYFLSLALGAESASGRVMYHHAFEARR